MRLRLHLDRDDLEAVLRKQAFWLAGAHAGSIQGAHALAELYEEIQPYSYLCAVVLTQSDEKRLQSAVNSLFTLCEKQGPTAVRFLAHELQTAHKPDVSSIASAYKQLRRFAFDPALEQLVVSEKSLLPLERSREELQRLFNAEHSVSDRTLNKQCQHICAILDDVAQQSTASEAAYKQAASIASYVRHEVELLRLRLAQHLTYAITAYPPKLIERGVSAHSSKALVRSYEHDCIAIENYLSYISTKAQHIELKPAQHNEKELLIGVRSRKSLDELERHLRDAATIERFNYIPYLLLRTDDKRAAHLLSRPKELFKGKRAAIYAPGTYKVQPIQAKVHTNDWNLTLIGAQRAWQRTRGENASVAVIDTGIDYEHQDLAERFSDVRGVDYVSGIDPRDDNGHGTHVAGTVAGKKTGVAPLAMLYAVKVLNARGAGSEVAVLKGIEWSIEKKVSVINMSLGSSYASSAEAELVRVASEASIAVACAAGNDGDRSYNYPASHRGAISVAAVDRNKRRAPFSNYNDMVDLAAPGESIYSTWPGGTYNVLSGTSMATPHVAGGCALLKSVGAQEAEHFLKRTAESLGPKEQYGSGLIRLGEAL